MLTSVQKNTLVAALSIAATFTSAANAQPLDADWLYLSGGGSWIARSETLLNDRSQLMLPIENLRADQFWWQASNAQTQLVWQQSDPAQLPQRGSSVEIDGEGGFWLVQDVTPSHLILQQGKTVRYWPQSQWHLLTWNQASDYGLALTVLQPENQKNELFYAWQDSALTAQVRYRLQQKGQGGTLFQELIVSNLTDSTISADGYSFAEQHRAPVVAMRAMSVASESAMMDTPQSGQSQGVPTLVSKAPVQLAANSHAWLPVSQTELRSVERRYSLNWDSRQNGAVTAQTELVLVAKDQLPDISGSVKVGIFDEQVALQESYYQAGDANSTSLSLGSSALVSLEATLISEGRWQLQVHNRSVEDAHIELLVNHRVGNNLQRLPMTLRIDAQSEQSMMLRQDSKGQLTLER